MNTVKLSNEKHSIYLHRDVIVSDGSDFKSIHMDGLWSNHALTCEPCTSLLNAIQRKSNESKWFIEIDDELSELHVNKDYDSVDIPNVNHISFSTSHGTKIRFMVEKTFKAPSDEKEKQELIEEAEQKEEFEYCSWLLQRETP